MDRRGRRGVEVEVQHLHPVRARLGDKSVKLGPLLRRHIEAATHNASRRLGHSPKLVVYAAETVFSVKAPGASKKGKTFPIPEFLRFILPFFISVRPEQEA